MAGRGVRKAAKAVEDQGGDVVPAPGPRRVIVKHDADGRRHRLLVDDRKPAQGDDAEQQVRRLAVRRGVEPDFIGDGCDGFLTRHDRGPQFLGQGSAAKCSPFDETHKDGMGVEIVKILADRAGQHFLGRAAAGAGPIASGADRLADILRGVLNDGAIQRPLAAKEVAGRAAGDPRHGAHVGQARRCKPPIGEERGGGIENGIARAVGITLAFRGRRHVSSLACCSASMQTSVPSVKPVWSLPEGCRAGEPLTESRSWSLLEDRDTTTHPVDSEMDVTDRVLLADKEVAIRCANCQAPLPGGAEVCPQCGQDVGTAVGVPDIVRRLRLALGPQFEVIRLVGRGGFAEVYEVQDTELRRRLAVKVLRTDIDWSPDMATRFKQEARAIAQLSHPHTVPIHFVGEGEGLVFYVMPFIEGLTLADILRADGPLDPKLAAGVAVPILDALEHAHRLGIVHRDIKPDNILVDGASGRPLLVDFGISTMRGVEHRPDDQVIGTPHYMSPEQALGERDIDARADLYAMGAVLLQMITGRPPFEGATSGEILAKHIADPLDLPDDDTLLPTWLRRVIERALQKRREERFESAGAMLTALREGMPDGTRALMTGTHPIPRISREDPTVQLHLGARARRIWPRRHSTRVLVTATILVSLIAIAYSSWITIAGLPPNLVVRNSLLAPVAVSVNGAGERQLAPGDSFQVPLARGNALAARWRVVGPRGDGGDLRGESLGGTIADSAPRGRLRSDITAGVVAPGYLAPRIMNATADTLRVELRDSLQARVPCGCDVPPGSSLLLGYYRESRLRSVEVRNHLGRTLIFESLLQRKNSATGEVALSIRPADFNPPRSIAPPNVAVPGNDRLLAPLPEIRYDEPELITDSSLPAADSAATVRPPTKQRDPLGSIFQNR